MKSPEVKKCIRALKSLIVAQHQIKSGFRANLLKLLRRVRALF